MKTYSLSLPYALAGLLGSVGKDRNMDTPDDLKDPIWSDRADLLPQKSEHLALHKSDR